MSGRAFVSAVMMVILAGMTAMLIYYGTAGQWDWLGIVASVLLTIACARLAYGFWKNPNAKRL